MTKQTKPFRLGTMYWLNPNFGEAEIERDVVNMKANRIDLIRSFLFWQRVETAPGVYDFRANDMLHRAAAKHGLKIMETFEIVRYPFAEDAVEPTLYGGQQAKMCLDRPDAQKWAEGFVRAAVGHFKDSPALAMWNLNNEPTKTPCLCEHTLKKFAAWLRDRYENTETMRRAYMKEFPSRGACAMPQSLDTLGAAELRELFKRTTRTVCVPLLFDFHDFMFDNLCDNIRWLGEIVRSIDNRHETHTNCTYAMVKNRCSSGDNNYRMAKVVDSISVSTHYSHHPLAYIDTVDNLPCVYSASVEAFRGQCAVGGKDVYVGELQAGTTFYHHNKFTPSPAEIKHAIYQAFGRGMRGVIFWEWQCWRGGIFEPGEFSLRRCADGGPTERSEAVAEAGAVLKKLAEKYSTDFENLCRPQTQIAIVTSHVDEIYKFLQAKNKPVVEGLYDEYNSAIYGCFKALYSTNIPVDIISVEQACGGGGGEYALGKYKVVLLPNMEMLDATTAKALEEFVRNGGWLWADGRCAFLDVGIFLRNEIPGHGLARVFGCNEADFIAVRESESFLLKNRTGSGLESGSGSGLELELKPFRFKQKLAATTGETTVTCNGEPVGMRNHYGKGCAELLGTYLCLGIHAAMDNPVMKAQLEAMQNVIVDFVRASGVPVRNDITTGFEISHLANDKLDVYIVTNRNAGGTELRMPLLQPCTTVECPQGGASFVGGVVRRDFAPMESALFVCRKLSRQ